MPDGSIAARRRLAGAARVAVVSCLSVVFADRAAAQVPQPVVAPAPNGPEMISRYDFHLIAYRLSIADDPFKRYSWDAHFGGSVDIIDYVVGRGTMTVDYETVMGHEFRAFDPVQGNYTLEGAFSARAGATELVAVFHHVSRHLNDRAKRVPVAWNTLGVRVLRHIETRGAALDVDLDVGHTTEHAFVDYTWIGSLQVKVQRALTPKVALFAHGTGQLFSVDGSVPDRGRQTGGLADVGVRLTGRGGVVELFAGIERRVDAYPLERVPRRWGLAGFRLLKR